MLFDDSTGLFKNIDNKKFFGITKTLMDRLYYLPELLKKAELRHISGPDYEITSKIELKIAGHIGLSYDFIASSHEEAELILKEYKSRMIGECQKTWLAFWAMANKRKSFNYTCSLSEIMKQAASITRVHYFSSKEKTAFWQSAKLLLKTSLKFGWIIKAKKTQRNRIFEILHPMLALKAQLSNLEERDFPNQITVSVLDPAIFLDRAFLPSAIRKTTLELHPADMMLALTLQARGAQMQNRPAMLFDEDYLIERANLEKTAKINKSTARALLSKKLAKLNDDEIIISFNKRISRYVVISANQNSSKISDVDGKSNA